MRDLSGKIKPPPPPGPTPINVIAATEAPANGSFSAQSFSISKPVPSSERVQTFLEKAADEGLVILQSPKVTIKILIPQCYIILDSKIFNGAGGFF